MESDELLKKRFRELADLADRRGQATYTNFLDLNEQHILHMSLQKFSWIQGKTFGGYEGAERQMAAFIPAYSPLYPAEESQGSGIPDPSAGLCFPISCIQIRPLNARFAEQLSHRDILGALMHLGIERSKTGDIAVREDEAFLFCSVSMAELICQELNRIRHTSVVCQTCQMEDFSFEPRTERIKGSVSSVRLDAVLALAFHASRSSLLSLIEGGRVFVNGRLITTNAYGLKDRDLISVRGMGKFRYLEALGQTKKGRQMIEIEKFI